MIVRAHVMTQNDVCVWIKFDCDPAMAASFFRVDLAIPGQILFFVMFPAPGQLAQADIKPVLGLERSPTLNRGSDELD